MKMEPFVAIPSDQSEPTKTNNMRRISSILKAPRTPLKSIGGEDGCQDCTNKPFEKKRRSSRRVSFAQTNNIKDFKNDSPVTKLLGDLDGTEMEDLDKENRLNADQDGKPQLLGMETLLNAPLQVPQQQNKERSFFEHGTMDTVADKTVVFSEEDNANMDMTYSHTIVISKDDDDINDVANCGNLDVGEFISRLDKNKDVGNADSRREYSYFSRCEDSTIFGNNSVKTSDFKNGLAKSVGQSGNRRFFSDPSSLTPLVQQNSVPPGPEKICSKDFLSRLKSHGSGFDKEKQASVLTERFDLQFINKTMLVDKEDNMDMTKSHTISIDTRTINENKCVIQPAEPDDMDMTKSQTVDIAYKEVMASDPFRVIPPKTRKLVAGLAGCSNETVVFSEELNEMDMTKSHTVAIDTKSILNTGEKPLDLCHNALGSCGLSSRPDYKDMTKSQMNSLDYKTNAALTNPAKDINKRCRSVLGFSVPADKTVLFSVDEDDMDMTKSHTVAIDNRSLFRQKREQNNKLVDMEMTRSQMAAVDCRTIEVTDPLMAVQTKPRSNATSFSAPYDRTVVFPEHLAEMEMTQSHTVSIDSTNILMAREKSEMCFSESRLPCSPSFTSVPKDMELAKGQTVKSDFKTTLAENSTSAIRRSKQSIFSLSVPADGTVVCSGEYDMDMTKSHTVAIDCKSIIREIDNPMQSSNSNVPSTLHSVISNADEMELTKSQTVFGMFEKSKKNPIGLSISSDKTIFFSVDQDEMNMTKSHTVSIDNRGLYEQNVEQNDMKIMKTQPAAVDSNNIEDDRFMGIHTKPRPNMTVFSALPDKTVFFSEGIAEMDMTKSHTVAIDRSYILPAASEAIARNKTGMLLSESILPSSHLSTSEAEDMELTKSQTAKIDFKTTAADSFVPKCNIRSGRSVLGFPVPADITVMFSGGCDDMDMTKSHTMAIETSSHFEQNEESDDMEMTRSQTVAIDWKNIEAADPFMGIPAKPKCNATSLLAPSDRTVLFSEDLAEMEITKSHTVAINSSNLLPESEKRAREKSGMFLSESILPHSHFSTSEPDDMELTKSQTVKIDFKTTAADSFAPKSNIRSRSVLGLSVPADRTVVFSGENDDMEMTRSQTVAIDYKNIEAADPFMGIQAKPKRNTTSLLAPSDRTLVFSEDFAEMEITKSHTVDIDSSNILPTNDKIGRDESGMFLSVSADRTVVFSGDCDNMDMTKSHTVVIDKRKVKEVGEDCMQSVPNSVQLNSEMSAAIKITRSQTSAVDCRPVEADSFIGIRQRPRKSVTFSSLPTDKTVVFSEDRNEMDMTKSNTVVIESTFFQNNANMQYLLKSDTEKTKNQTIANDVKSSIEINHPNAQGNKRFKQSVPRLSAPVDKTTLLTDDQDEMDTTKSHTLAVGSSNLLTQREKTTGELNNSILRVDCSVLDQQNMDITRSQTVFIDCSTNPAAGNSTKSKQYVAALSISEKNIEFSKQCDDMDMARSHTVAIESRRPFEQVPRLQFQDDKQIIGNQTVTIGHQNSEIVNPLIKSKSASDESVPIKTITFSKGENMEKTKGQEVAIKGRSPVQGSERDVESQEMSVQCMSRTIKPDIFSSSDKPALGMSVLVDGLATEKTLSDSRFCFEPQNVNKLDEERGSEDKSNCFGLNNQEVKRESVPFIVSDLNLESREQMKKADLTELTCEINRTVEESGELSLQNSGAINEAVKMANRRRRSLVDLQSKLKNIKNMINKSETGMTCHTAPLPKLIKLSETETEDKCDKDSFPRNECNNPNAADYGEVHFAVSEEPKNLQCNDNSSHVDLTRNMTTPVNFCYDKPQKTSMSFGGFLPKLPQKKKILNSKTLNCAQSSHFGKVLINAVTSDTAIQQGNNDPVQNIDEEILPYYTDEEDSAENMNCEFPAENCDKENPVETVETDVGVNDSGFDKPVLNQTPRQKRPLQEDGHEDIMVHDRKIKRSPDVPSANQEKEARVCRVQWSSSALGITAEILPSGTMTKTFDTTSGSSNSMNLKAEATFDSSAQRCSRFESQFLEEIEDLQEKLQDGSITAKEFLQLLDVYMHIQRPRQSTLPHNVASDSAPKTEVLLKEKYIYRPQQQVYEEDCQALTETVDKLKTRICDQEKTLKSMNESLWLTVKSYSKEQLRSLAFKLNEKKVQFRKNVKAYFHEIKIDSYSKLVQCAQTAQQDLKEKINLTEGLLQNLNECFHNLEAELAGLDCSEMEEENVNPELELTLKTRQEELENLNAEGADCERKLFKLVTENKQLETEVCKLQVKTQELELYIQDLNRLSEWTLTQWLDGRAVFTFLNGSLELELVFEAPRDETHSSEKAVLNILAINFYTLLDDERAHPSSLVIHSLINQFINSKESWCKKYSTQYDIPKLLHDFSIVVSHLRLLGQELRYLKKWGPLKFDILEMTLLDTHVKILFSSVKGFAKFEITLALTPAYPFSRLVLLDFKNYIGNLRWEQIEEVLCAVQPENDYLTRIVEKIHLNLLTKPSVHF
ncbi:kinetochore scaffold 1 [Lepisosteus oculatus]|uniref:Kinetochore scaffold 1 n=1 Tax=Lepisosteus oculatus TaxID=7918 RepID=W5N4R8_LEPOC|nr:PREDICTED: protein CASC5 [Lepisosteus oculatus]